MLITAIGFGNKDFGPVHNVLSLCSAVASTQAYCLLERSFRVSAAQSRGERGSYIAANGSLLSRGSTSSVSVESSGGPFLLCLTQFSAFSTGFALLAAYVFELSGRSNPVDSRRLPTLLFEAGTHCLWVAPRRAVNSIAAIVMVSAFYKPW